MTYEQSMTYGHWSCGPALLWISPSQTAQQGWVSLRSVATASLEVEHGDGRGSEMSAFAEMGLSGAHYQDEDL